ncbi:MAG: DNA polymerase I [Bdellovibrionaceae bacterium]|nr:DNA polymerase I [Pseudobdellovibrionaceae bacterium]
MSKKNLYLVDVSSLFFRAFYAIRPLTSPSGLPVNAIYGFMTMVMKLLKDEKPDAVVFCFDRPEPSFRKELDPNYKANRSEMPEDLIPQIPYIKKIGPLLGVACADVLGFEADDIIGTLTKKGHEKGYDVVIVSGDKDFAQLLKPGVVMYDTMKAERTGPAEALAKWGIRPDQMIDYLALVGDSSDNVPGVKGIGPKGAQKLLTDFDSLDGIYANIENIKGATKDKLVNDKANAYLSQKLVTIVCDVPLQETVESYHLEPVKVAEIEELITDLNFKNLAKTIRELPNHPDNQVPDGFTIATDVASTAAGEKKALPNFAPKTTETPPTPQAPAASAEADGIEIEEIEAPAFLAKFPRTERLWLFSGPMGVYLSPNDDQKIYRLSGEMPEWTTALSSPDQKLCGFDIKALGHELKLEAIHMCDDLQVKAYLLAPGEGSDLALVVSKVLGEVLPDALSPTEHFALLLRLNAKLDADLDETQQGIYRTLDLPLIPILFDMEKRGVRLDLPRLAKQSEGLAADIKSVEKKVHELAGREFNIGSPKQLGAVLFDELKLPPGRKTKTGYSTDTDVMDKLKPLHPIAAEILTYRELTKLKSTYVDALPLLADGDARVHTTFNSTHTATGRLSSLNPNLQNIPIRTARGEEVRKAFVASPGKELLSIDYSQIELRILAHYADDANLIQAFKDDLDIHAATASEIFQVPLSEVTADHRRTAKAVNFGIAYGQGAFGLAETLGIPRGQAQEIIARYFQRFPGVGRYIESTIAQAQADGFVSTLFGRKRYMKEFKSANPAIRKFGERAAINAPIQGTAADIVKKAMIDVVNGIGVPMTLQVHDELIFEDTPERLREATPEIIRIMESVVKIAVPLKVNAAQGPNWSEAH